MNTEFMQALKDLQREKGISSDSIIDALEKALAKSYEKNYNDHQNVKINIDPETGKLDIFAEKLIVDSVEEPIIEISLNDARKINANYQIGETVLQSVTPHDFGRIAAQTARNIVLQKIKDAERAIIFSEFEDREHEIITGIIQRMDRNYIYIELGKTEGMIPPSEQVSTESYRVGDRLKLYISEVKNTAKGAQVILSRNNPGLVVRLFELEIPEISDGVVEIFSIAREAGSRTKIAVFSKDENVDPVGACVGFKGTRVKAIVTELRGEKIDIIIWDKNIKTFIKNSLSPANIVDVIIDEENKSAVVVAQEEQLSLAIGKEGQNARLAAKLTGWKIDIKDEHEAKALNLKDKMIEKNIFDSRAEEIETVEDSIDD
ncbi:transcription termination factor NusA [Peptostreptococcaceae bacterium oral taxon 113 str. W5053]|nr:transcription termination factor NusA [Peptostreptococcaceae bacterium oral taxon 113 str. W5053]